jgi:hypothetical protein
MKRTVGLLPITVLEIARDRYSEPSMRYRTSAGITFESMKKSLTSKPRHAAEEKDCHGLFGAGVKVDMQVRFVGMQRKSNHRNRNEGRLALSRYSGVFSTRPRSSRSNREPGCELLRDHCHSPEQS